MQNFDKSYVLYFPAGKGEDEEIEILASSYIQDEEGKQGQLKPVETDEEWDMIEEILATFLADETKNNIKKACPDKNCQDMLFILRF